jgi:hypothetical protein
MLANNYVTPLRAIYETIHEILKFWECLSLHLFIVTHEIIYDASSFRVSEGLVILHHLLFFERCKAARMRKKMTRSPFN